ncbi:Rrf2 family transcriptional regulator [Aurantimonas sp. C2-6-R+9]|uniref:Rrf2 family transcriptional regulator n=1 Tax=unclassified Aurantimonas TaxID=2638230 RepID=UPI002E16EA2D|nr:MULTISPECIES: Rrf2 family transcriptional regulator [unclassified Aurantimonas]MEC5290857.1 Rrf2 family transcriptional regulator [Aurantimonas sp. C2-3-R2]MEC5381034.1 Rrf2 family transcriptional regulator [Aurantimonas sp. C2-6-R+9]MEC5412007.1 Rrf2 family transcriptional regulator [Aurantimonas sp. C2-4-R8]
MHLTRYTDYALRVLIYSAARPHTLCSIGEISTTYGVSHNHLTKVAHEVGNAGCGSAARRRGGLT